MNPMLRLPGAATSHGLLTGQIVFSAAIVAACELPNWIHTSRQVNAYGFALRLMKSKPIHLVSLAFSESWSRGVKVFSSYW